MRIDDNIFLPPRFDEKEEVTKIEFEGENFKTMDNDNIFISGRYKIIEIIKPSKVKVFKNAELYDVLDISLRIEKQTTGRNNSTKRLTFYVYNMSTGEGDSKYINTLVKCLEGYKLRNVRRDEVLNKLN